MADLFRKNKDGAGESFEEHSAASPSGELTVSRSRRFDLITKIGCFVVAFIVWLYVMSMDSTTYTRDFYSVPVKIVNNSELSVLSGADSVVDISVSGKRGVINKLSDGDIEASADASDITAAGKHRLEVSVSLPGGVTLASASPTYVSVYLDNTTSITVPITLNITDYMLEGGYELGESDAVFNRSEIVVTGPEEILNNIASARLSLSLGHVSRSVTSTGPLELVDKNGDAVSNSYVKMQVSSATVELPVYYYRTVPLTAEYKYGYYNAENVALSFSPDSITVKGEYETVMDYEWVYTVDEKRMTSDGPYTIPLSLPDGIINVDGVSRVTLELKHKGTSVREVTLPEIEVINPKNLNYELVSDSVTLQLRCDDNYSLFATPANITASVNLSSYTSVSGTALVPVTVTVADWLSGKLYELGSYSVSVKFS